MAERLLWQGRPVSERAFVENTANHCRQSCGGEMCASCFHCPSSGTLYQTDMTAEEIREKRRVERKQFKIDRAAAIAQAAAEAEAAFAEGREAKSSVVIPSGATWKPQQPAADESARSSPVPDEPVEFDESTVPELEHLQLTLQEAFFLAWNLDCLTILDPTTVDVKCLQCISFAESDPCVV